jgi:asparagine synthase (glutamine-hydrolysing)
MGEATMVDPIRLFPDTRIAVVNGAATLEDRPPIRAAGRSHSRLDDAAELCVGLLRERFRALADRWPAIDSALSGGYDSRLLLALARDAKLAPRLHVYGRATDPDVVCAQTIARAEGFPLHHVDKSTVPQPDPARYADIVHANYLAFDGCPTDGIFDNGTDLDTRRKRVAGGALMLNGGGGEIFRNFFYLPDRPLSALDVVWTFYCQFDPKVCAADFDEPRYLDGLAQRIAARVGAPDGRLTRQQVEAVYPLFRCTYWTGLNNSINNRLGHAWTPFLDAELIAAALDVPLAFKNMGRLEGRMIAMLAPELAAQPSVYGRPFDRSPGAVERLKDLASRQRPPLLRRLTYRLKRRTTSPWSGALDRTRLERVIDLGFPVMGRYFRLDAVRDPEQLRRICTLEYMFGQLNLRGNGATR